MKYFAIIVFLMIITCISTEPVCKGFTLTNDLINEAGGELSKVVKPLKLIISSYLQHKNTGQNLYKTLKDFADVFGKIKCNSFPIYNMYLIAKQHIVQELKKPAMCLWNKSLAALSENNLSLSECNVLHRSLYILSSAVKGDMDETNKKMKEALPCYKLLFSEKSCDDNCQNIVAHELKERDLIAIENIFKLSDHQAAVHWQHSAGANQLKKTTESFLGKINGYSDHFRSSSSKTRVKRALSRQVRIAMFSVELVVATYVVTCVLCLVFGCNCWICKPFNSTNGSVRRAPNNIQNVADPVQHVPIDIDPVPIEVLSPPVVVEMPRHGGGHTVASMAIPTILPVPREPPVRREEQD